MAGISSFGRRSRARPRASGVALWSSARRISSAVSGLPGGRIIERRNRRGEPITQEQPAPPDPPRGQVAATCELVHGGARDAEQVGHLPGRHDICACQGALGRRSHLPKRGPEPPKRTPGGRLRLAPPGLRLAGGWSPTGGHSPSEDLGPQASALSQPRECGSGTRAHRMLADASVSSVATVDWRSPSALPTQLRMGHGLERPRRPPVLATQRASGGRGARRGPPRRWAVVRWARPGRGAASAPRASTPLKRSGAELVDGSGAPRAPARGPRTPGSVRGRYPRDPRQPGDLKRVI